MKTNHQRGFKDKKHRTDGENWVVKKSSEFADVSFAAGPWGCDERYGRKRRKSKAGAKKFVNSRIRNAERQKLRTMDFEEE